MVTQMFRRAYSLGRGALFMLESVPVVLVISSAMGFLAGIGVGGGSLLMMWLTLVLGMAHAQARLLNLLFFLPSALVACLFRWKQGSLDIHKILPAVIAGCIAAGVGSWISIYLDMNLLKKLFGGLLILTGIRELLYKPKKKEHP